MKIFFTIAGLVAIVFALIESAKAQRAQAAGNFEDEVRWRLQQLLSWAMIVFCAVMSR